MKLTHTYLPSLRARNSASRVWQDSSFMPCEWINVGRMSGRIRAILIPWCIIFCRCTARWSSKLRSPVRSVTFATLVKYSPASAVAPTDLRFRVQSNGGQSTWVDLSLRGLTAKISSRAHPLVVAGCFIRSILEEMCTLRRWNCASLYVHYDYNRKSFQREWSEA